MAARKSLERALRSAPLYFLIMTIGGAGCLPMGLPEKFADLNKGNARRPAYAAVITNEAKNFDAYSAAPLLHRALGSQFLFAIIPFTKLFFQHTEQEFLKEVLINSLQDEGYTVITLQPGSEISIPGPDVIVSASIPDLRVNAYDAIFFRIVRITGNLTVTFHDSSPGFPQAWQESLPLDRTAYRAYAHAAMLSAAVESEIKKALSSSFRAIRQRRHNALCREHASQTYILPPQLRTDNQDELGKALLGSYGINARKGYQPGEIARIVQRGLLLGAKSSDISPAAITGFPPKISCPRLPAALEAVVRSVSIDSSFVSVTLTLSLLEGGGAKIFESTCNAEAKQRKNLDGSAVVALEEAAAEAAEVFLTKRNNEKVRCSDDHSQSRPQQSVSALQ